MYFRTGTKLLLSPFLLHVLFLAAKLAYAGDPEKISLHASMIKVPKEGTSLPQSSDDFSPEKISSGRMKPISSTGSPRFEEAAQSLGIDSHNQIKGISHIGILSDPASSHTYPKVTVRAGKKKSIVINQFHHPYRPTENAKPYQYMQHQHSDDPSDLNQPAFLYKIGQRKVGKSSVSVQHAKSISKHMSHSQYHPKAAIFHNLPGDQHANRKAPTIDVDPGRLHGHLLTTVYGPESPPKSSLALHQSQNHPQIMGQVATGHSQSPTRSPRSPTRDRISSPGGGNGSKKQRVE